MIKKSLRIKPNENVIVETWTHGLEAAQEIVYQLRAVGARPMLLYEDEATHWRSVETLPPSKLGQVSAPEWAALKAADAYIFLPGPADIDRYRRNMEKMEAAFRYNDAWYRNAEKARVRGARVLLGYVSPERATAYGLEYPAWRQMILDASSTDFAAVARNGRKIGGLLSKEADVEVSSANGTRLTFSLKGRRAKVEDGVVDAEDLKAGDVMTGVPGGQAYVATDETSAEGVLISDLPAAYLGRFVRGIRVTFEDGKATWSAEENEAVYRGPWDRDKGPKDRLGALGIGLNPAAHPGFLQNDIVAGVVEVGVGSNASFGGKNKTNFYLPTFLREATVKIGSKVVVDEGRLAV